MKILAVSDEVVERLYSLCSNGHFNDVQLILGCGDLPYPYLENLLTILNVPLMYVPGNHDPNFQSENKLAYVEGGINLDMKLIRFNKFLIGGLGGSIQYRPDGSNQYSQGRSLPAGVSDAAPPAAEPHELRALPGYPHHPFAALRHP